MASNKPTHEIVHPKLYLMVDGKMTKVEKGSQVTLTAKHAERLGDKVMKVGDKKQVALGGSGDGDAEAVEAARIAQCEKDGIDPVTGLPIDKK